MTSPRRRRSSLLPALSAAFVGALVAGAATVVAGGPTEASLGPVDLAVAGFDAPNRGPATTANAAATTTGATTTTQRPTQSPPARSPERTPQTTEAAPPPPTTERTAETTTPPPARPRVTEQEQVVALVNAARADHGCQPLRVAPELTRAAQGHSSDMAARDYFDHTTPEGVGFAERIIAAGYPDPGAENIARGQRSAAHVMDSWMESEGHRENILNCELAAIGVGLDQNGWYWTQDFGY